MSKRPDYEGRLSVYEYISRSRELTEFESRKVELILLYIRRYPDQDAWDLGQQKKADKADHLRAYYRKYGKRYRRTAKGRQVNVAKNQNYRAKNKKMLAEKAAQWRKDNPEKYAKVKENRNAKRRKGSKDGNAT